MQKLSLFKRIGAFGLCFLSLMLLLSACASSGGDVDTSSGSGIAAYNGVFLERDIAPFDLKGEVADILISDNGEVQILTKAVHPQLTSFYWTLCSGQSNEENFTLTQEELFSDFRIGNEELLAGEDFEEIWHVENACFLPSGGYLIEIMKANRISKERVFHYYLVNEDGSSIRFETPLASFLESMRTDDIHFSTYTFFKYLGENRILLDYPLPETNERIRAVHNFDTGEEIFRLSADIKDNWYLYNGAIISCSSDGKISAQNIENGKKAALPAFLNFEDNVKQAFNNNSPLEVITPEGNFLQANRGVFSLYAASGKQEVPAFYPDIYRLFSARYTPYGLYALPNGKFLSFFGEYFSDGKHGDLRLAVYEYDEDASAEITTEIEVYSLYEQINMTEIIYEYQHLYPNIKVNYSFDLPVYDPYMLGFDEQIQQAIKEQDAIKTLNTRLLGGSGPDVLILDGLPMQAYAENELLYDVAELNSGDVLLQSIIAPMEDENGALYCLPTRFSLPVIVGDDDFFNNLNSYEELYNALENAALKLQSPAIIATPNELMFCFYAANQPSLFSEGPNTENINQFFETAAAVHSLIKPPENSTFFSSYDHDYPKAFGLAVRPSFWQFIEGRASGAIGIISSFKVLDETNRTMSWREHFSEDGIFYNKTFSANPFPTMEYNTYLPGQICGVYGQSNEKEAAINFVNAMLSHDMQRIDLGTGFPVRSETLNKAIDDYNAPPLINFTTQGYNPIAFDIYGILENLDTPVIEDYFLRDSLLVAYSQYFYGMLSLDEAVEKVISDTLLFYAEK